MSYRRPYRAGPTLHARCVACAVSTGAAPVRPQHPFPQPIYDCFRHRIGRALFSSSGSRVSFQVRSWPPWEFHELRGWRADKCCNYCILEHQPTSGQERFSDGLNRWGRMDLFSHLKELARPRVQGLSQYPPIASARFHRCDLGRSAAELRTGSCRPQPVWPRANDAPPKQPLAANG